MVKTDIKVANNVKIIKPPQTSLRKNKPVKAVHKPVDKPKKSKPVTKVKPVKSKPVKKDKKKKKKAPAKKETNDDEQSETLKISDLVQPETTDLNKILNSLMDPPPKILYVTSFTKNMFDLTGKELIKSFLDTDQVGDLLYCHEGFDPENMESPEESHLIPYRLDTNSFLNEWLEDNEDIIPDYLGGLATAKTKPELFSNKWNRMASRWFRKIASLNYALETYGNVYDYIIWVDSDCHFKQTIPIYLYKLIFEKYGMFYYFGQVRKLYDSGYETGFLGFSKNNNGFKLLRQWIDLFDDPEFAEFKRWDDGYVLRILMEEIKPSNAPSYDLALLLTHNPLNATNLFSNYIFHKKGLHQRRKIMY